MALPLYWLLPYASPAAPPGRLGPYAATPIMDVRCNGEPPIRFHQLFKVDAEVAALVAARFRLFVAARGKPAYSKSCEEILQVDKLRLPAVTTEMRLIFPAGGQLSRHENEA
jgi:hypothetical protein